MSDYKYSSQTLIKTQQYAWYISLVYFAFVALIYLVDWKFADTLAIIGVIFIIAVTIFKLVIMGQHFKSLNLIRFSLLSYILVFILVATVIWRFFR